jgi:hypothetical protein
MAFLITRIASTVTVKARKTVVLQPSRLGFTTLRNLMKLVPPLQRPLFLLEVPHQWILLLAGKRCSTSLQHWLQIHYAGRQWDPEQFLTPTDFVDQWTAHFRHLCVALCLQEETDLSSLAEFPSLEWSLHNAHPSTWATSPSHLWSKITTRSVNHLL